MSKYMPNLGNQQWCDKCGSYQFTISSVDYEIQRGAPNRYKRACGRCGFIIC